MAKLQLLAGLAMLASLAACGEAASPPANRTAVTGTEDASVLVPAGNGTGESVNAAAPAAAIDLAPDGLVLALPDGGARQASFGQERAAVVAMISAAAGQSTGKASNPECGAGPLDSLDFKGGLRLYFQHGSFAGWHLDGRGGGAYATAAGIGIGSTRADLEKAGSVTVAETSLGHELDADGLGGLLSATEPGGKVTSLWAGTTCIFR